MVGLLLAIGALAALVMVGAVPGIRAILAAAIMAIGAVLLAQVWAVATWGADRWIARARTEG
jgi:hypothetical protein